MLGAWGGVKKGVVWCLLNFSKPRIVICWTMYSADLLNLQMCVFVLPKHPPTVGNSVIKSALFYALPFHTHTHVQDLCCVSVFQWFGHLYLSRDFELWALLKQANHWEGWELFASRPNLKKTKMEELFVALGVTFLHCVFSKTKTKTRQRQTQRQTQIQIQRQRQRQIRERVKNCLQGLRPGATWPVRRRNYSGH